MCARQTRDYQPGSTAVWTGKGGGSWAFQAVGLAALLASSATLRARTTSTQRRRPTTGEAQEKRKAWGREWGQSNHENKLRRDREKGSR